jgi:hypothetical protein
MICFSTHEHRGPSDRRVTVIMNEHIEQHDDNGSSKLICIIQEVGAPSEIQNSIFADDWLIVAVLASFSFMIFHMRKVVMGGDVVSVEYLCLLYRVTYHLHLYVYTYVLFLDTNIPTYVCIYKVNANLEHSIHT